MRFLRIGMNQTDWGTNKLPTIADAMAVSRNALDGATLVSAEPLRAIDGRGVEPDVRAGRSRCAVRVGQGRRGRPATSSAHMQATGDRRTVWKRRSGARGEA